MTIRNTEEKRLTPREQAFAVLVADPTDARSVGDKGLAVGWANKPHAYRVASRAHVAAEIDRLVTQRMRTIRARALRVLDVLATRAEAGDVKAAGLFLEAAGFLQGRGVNVVTQIGQPEPVVPFAERLRRIQAARLDQVADVRASWADPDGA